MANRFLVSGGTGNYNSTTNWSTTSGGASGASFPVAADAIIVDANSLNAPLTINVPSQCLSFICSNYTGNLVVTSTLNVMGTLALGNITLSTGMTVTGSGTITKVPTGTTGVITSNSVIIGCNFAITPIATATTTTLTGSMTVNGNFDFGLVSTTLTTTINTGQLNIGGNLSYQCLINGTSNISFVSSTTASITFTGIKSLSNNLIFNKSGILNIIDLYFSVGGRTITYTAGVINHTGTLYLSQTLYTFNTNGMSWNNIEQTGSGTPTYTINSLLIINKYTGNGRGITFQGTSGFNVNTFITNPAATGTITFTFKTNVTYTFNTLISIMSTALNPNVFLRGLPIYSFFRIGPNCLTKLYPIGTAQGIDARQGKPLRLIGTNLQYGTSTLDCFNVECITDRLNQYNKTF